MCRRLRAYQTEDSGSSLWSISAEVTVGRTFSALRNGKYSLGWYREAELSPLSRGRKFFYFSVDARIIKEELLVMEQQLKELRESAVIELAKADSLDMLNDLRVKYLGKKGSLTSILRGMGALSAEERPRIGQIVNEIRAELEGVI
jgi:hypothetical protein